MMSDIFNNIEKSINRANSILVVSHMDPDGDSIGSQLAMYKHIVSLGKKAIIVTDGIIPGKYGFFPGLENLQSIKYYRNDIEFDLVIFLECPQPERAGKVLDLVKDGIEQINIDHHPDNTGYGNLVYLNAEASAVGEILTYYFEEIGYEIDSDTAELLYAAILTDTGRFRFESTTQRTMEAAGKLITAGANPRKISDLIYYSMPESVLKLTAKALSSMEILESGKIGIITLDKKALNGHSTNPADTEGMAEYTLYGADVIVGGFIREIDDGHIKVSLRSRDTIDVSALAHEFGGGGHVNASGFVLSMNIKQAREVVLNRLKETVNAQA